MQSLEAGVSQEEAWQIASEKGFKDFTELQLIYVPGNLSNDFPTGGVYWWFVQSKMKPSQRSLYLNFYTGQIVREVRSK